MTDKGRYQTSKKVSVISIIINIILSLFKVYIGLNFASKALVADGIHSASDMISTVVILFSIRFAQSPADKKHPYGHGKAEALGTAVLGIMLVATGLVIVKDTADAIISGNIARPERIALWIALISILVKEGLYRYTIEMGRRINSKGLIADAHHHRSDAFSSIAALIGIAGARLGLPLLDPLAGLVVALFISKIGLEILKEAVDELMDGLPDEAKIERLSNRALAVDGVLAIGDIRVRAYGPKLYVDLEVVVPSGLSVEEGHRIAAEVKEAVQEKDASVVEVLVHVDPAGDFDQQDK